MHSSRWLIEINIVTEKQNVPVMYWEWTEIIYGWEGYGKAILEQVVFEVDVQVRVIDKEILHYMQRVPKFR